MDRTGMMSCSSLLILTSTKEAASGENKARKDE
jgi:hypothetical protein